MPITYHVNNDDDLIVVTANGQLDIESAGNTAFQLLVEADFDPDLPQLIDLRAVDDDHVANIAPLLDFLGEQYLPHIDASVAVVIDTEVSREDAAAAFHMCCKTSHAELFDDYGQALRWLVAREYSPPQQAAG